MPLVRMLLKKITGIIYLLFVMVVLYFPFAGLLDYFGRETRLFRFESKVEIGDTLLPCLALAVLYGLVMAARRRIERSAAGGNGEQIEAVDRK